MSLRTNLAAERLVALDAADVIAYNERVAKPYHLHVEMGPSAFEGDIDSAPVILLLANPGYDATSTLTDHTFQSDNWPLSGLHPGAPLGLQRWWMRRLRSLVELVGAKKVSQSIACLQLTPWASERFDRNLRLPSRRLMLEAANQCALRDAIMIVMRGQQRWLEAEMLHASSNRYRVNSWRASYVSPGNLTRDAWEKVQAVMLRDGQVRCPATKHGTTVP